LLIYYKIIKGIMNIRFKFYALSIIKKEGLNLYNLEGGLKE
jgi:hypothetical protein